MVRIVYAVMVVVALAGCSHHKQKDLKSPCVAADSNQPDQPCARRPANAWLS